MGAKPVLFMAWAYDRLGWITTDVVGTIDYGGETLVEAPDQVDRWFAGSALLDHSHAATVDGALVSAVLTMSVDHAPFIAIVMADPANKNTGPGRAVTMRSLASLANAGTSRAVLYITEGNTPSERMFASLGAQPTPPHRPPTSAHPCVRAG